MVSTSQILQGIQLSTGHQLLQAVRYTTAPPGPIFIPTLDTYLTQPSSSHAASSSTNPTAFPSNSGSSSSLQRGNLIEIQGPSGSGKTKFLEFITWTSLLPGSVEIEVDLENGANDEGGGFLNSYPHQPSHILPLPENRTKKKVTIPIHGKSLSMIYIHYSTTPSPILSIGRQMRSWIEECFKKGLNEVGIPGEYGKDGKNVKDDILNPYKEIINQILREALNNLTVFTIPESSNPYAGLAATLSHIPVWKRKKRMVEKEVAMVLIDGLGEGYWQGRREGERMRSGGRGTAITTSASTTTIAAEGATTMVTGSTDTSTNNRDSTSHGHFPPLEGIRTSSDASMHDIMRSITFLRKDLGVVVVVTLAGLWRGRGQTMADGSGEERFWDSHLGWPYPTPFASEGKRDGETSSERRPDRPQQPRENAALPSPYWPLSFQLTLSSPSGHPMMVNSNSIGQYRADMTLREAMGGEGEKREEARRDAEWRGLCRVVGREGVGEFGFRIGSQGLTP